MAFERRITLPGSERKSLPKSQLVSPINENDIVRVTIVLRPNSPQPATHKGNGPYRAVAYEEFKQKHGANPEDIALVERFAHEYHLTIVDSSAPKRRVIVTGTAAAMIRHLALSWHATKSRGPNTRFGAAREL